MNSKFKTQDGKDVNVIEWDEKNNIAYVKFPNGNKIWVGKKEYSTWEAIGDSEVPMTKSVHIPDMPSQMTDQQAKSVNYDLVTDQIKTESDAIQEPSTEKIPVDEPPGDSLPVEQGISQPEEPAKESENTGEKEVKTKRKYTKKQNL